jgi:hypothetical protein
MKLFKKKVIKKAKNEFKESSEIEKLRTLFFTELKKVIKKAKNEFRESSEIEKLRTLFFTELKKEVKTFNIDTCPDTFLKGIDKGIIAVAVRSIEKTKTNSKHKLN